MLKPLTGWRGGTRRASGPGCPREVLWSSGVRLWGDQSYLGPSVSKPTRAGSGLLDTVLEPIQVAAPDGGQDRAGQPGNNGSTQPPGEGERFGPGESGAVPPRLDAERSGAGDDPPMLDSDRRPRLPLRHFHDVDGPKRSHSGGDLHASADA